MAEKEEKEFLYYQMINGKALYKVFNYKKVKIFYLNNLQCSNCVFEVKDFYRLKRHLCAKTGCLFEKNDKQIDQNLWELKSIRLVPEKLINVFFYYFLNYFLLLLFRPVEENGRPK